MDLYNKGTQYRTPASRQAGRASSEGPNTKKEKRLRLGGNVRARHVYCHPHAPRIFKSEYERLTMLVRNRPENKGINWSW